MTISGPPGSGTTTAAAQVESALGLDLLLGGEVFRAMAVEYGMSLADFGGYVAENPELDVELDRRLAQRAKAGGVVLESRLAGWIAANEQLDGLRVGLRCAERIRASRVAEREDLTVEQALADNASREKTERERYLALYGIDILDRSVYHLVVDTGVHDAAEVCRQIVAAARDRFPAG